VVIRNASQERAGGVMKIVVPQAFAVITGAILARKNLVQGIVRLQHATALL
jgi:hypothetical protein